MRTPITYYGGKQSIISHILELIPQHETYTEVFFGGGTLFWEKEPVKNEVINDRLDFVVNFYEQLKTNFKNLKMKIDATLISRTQHRQALNIIHNKEAADKVDLAWAFWMCSNFSYFNKLGGGIKYSNRFHTSMPDILKYKKECFTEKLCKRIEHACIENNDAIKVLKSRNVENAFHYLDPPYFNADQGHYKGYTENDFIDLLNTCKYLKGTFLLSNYNSKILDYFIKENAWHKKEIIHKLKAPRKSGDVKREILVWNYYDDMQMCLGMEDVG